MTRLLAVSATLVLAAVLASPVFGAIRIVKIYYDSPGYDGGSNASLNAEWIRLKNTGNTARQLRNWRIRDAAGHVYRFGGLRLRPGKTVTLHTGSGTNGPAHRYWNNDNYIWNNDKDTAKLKRPNGTVADTCSYNNSAANAKVC